MARSRLTYREAVRLLTGGTDWSAVLGRLAGGALLVATPFATGVLSLFDAKGEANALLRDLVGRAPDRIRASRGKSHYELLEAAHTVLVLSALFEALEEELGERYRTLELTDDEKRAFGNGGPPMPGPLVGFAENQNWILAELFVMCEGFMRFIEDSDLTQRRIVDRALALYRERYVRLAADVPEFAIWSQLDEHAATRAEVRKQTETLTHLADLLSSTVKIATPAAEAEERLARHASLVLERKLWQAEAPAPAGLSFPTVEQGFISPRFRITVSDRKKSRLGDESWWNEQPERDDLATFLASYVADPASTQRPLVVLGHPGAGKSLLTEVLAARLPASAYTTIRVPLRRVDPDAHIHQQVEATVEQLVKERISWGALCRASSTTKVLVLDGFDELVQATGVAQSHYIDLAASFQQEEWVNDRPVIVVITSRTLVMDRTAPPDGTVVVKLEPFDEAQVERWTAAWNAVNTGRPLAAAQLWHHRALAGQPLLLLMLAVHATEHGLAEDLSTEQLYARLLDSFIRRQVREKAAADLGETRFAELEADSRRDLAAAAFAMFNRGRQYVSEEDLDRDLAALRPDPAPATSRHGEPLTRARRTVAGFYFVHIARTPGRRTFEFMHATFAEYLVAEHTVELLTDLADDWRRSRRRTYGANLDDRVLRLLLSHQPLTNGEQVTPFLIGLLDRLPPDVRRDLREALLELFRGARKRIDDDAYNPTPFDAVNRLAAYTANLVVLAALCDESGVPIDALCDHPDAPDIASTVRLWRSGLDTEAQNSLFSRLRRVDNHLTARQVQARFLPLCEADLIGESFTEAIILSGRKIWGFGPTGTETITITPFQLSFHTAVLRLLDERWAAPPLGRMTPYDERLYIRLAEQAEASEDLPVPGTIKLLAQSFVDDALYLSPSLVDRLVGRVFLRAPTFVGQPMLSIVALQRPELLTRHPELRRRLFDSVYAPFLHEVARAIRREHPTALDPIVEEFRESLTGSLFSEDATPSMVSGLVFHPELWTQCLHALRGYGSLAWSQVPPGDLAAGIRRLEDPGPVMDIVREYVACREGETFEGEDAEAFAELQARAA